MSNYRGNPLLKSSGVEQEWTAEQITEWVKCSNDPKYFIETYVKIINIDDGLVSFKLRDYQSLMIDTMHNNRFTLISTCRQAGKSTTTTGYILHYLLFHSNKSIAILANKEMTAKEILKKVQLSFQHLPKWLQQGVVTWGKNSFELENGSSVLAAATSSDSIRGFSINVLFIDEAAHIDNFDEFFTSTFPVISSGRESKVILVSTPKGMNHWYRLWTDSVEGRNEYKRVKVTWREIPGRDEEWRKMTLGVMGNDYERFAQEHEVEFLGSSGTLIAGWKLKELVHQTPITEKEGYRIYKDKIPGHKYAICADVSEGKGMDYHAYSVIDVTTMPYEQVATYRNNMTGPTDYAYQMHNVAKHYNEASILIEVNIAMGPEVAGILHGDLEYENVLATTNAGARGKKISSGFGNNVDMGLRTSKTTKATGCSMLKLLIESNQLIINDFDTIQELSTFSRDTKKSFSAEPGKHDDTVMALVLFAWLSGQNYFVHLTDINTLARIREKTDEEMLQDVMPFGFVSNGLPDEAPDGITLKPGEQLVGQWGSGNFGF